MSEHAASPAMWDATQGAHFFLAPLRIPHDLQAEGGGEPESTAARAWNSSDGH